MTGAVTAQLAPVAHWAGLLRSVLQTEPHEGVGEGGMGEDEGVAAADGDGVGVALGQSDS
jgi:hypothetical protein